MSTDHQSPIRELPIKVRPSGDELSGSYIARLARANRTTPWTLLQIIGRTPSDRREPHPEECTIILNNAAFDRLLGLTRLTAYRLIRAIPSFESRNPGMAGAEPAVLVKSVTTPVSDCPECRMLRSPIRIDMRLHPDRLACLRHSRWLYATPGSSGLDIDRLPDVAAAFKRFQQLIKRHGKDSTLNAFKTANYLLRDGWRQERHATWHPHLIQRWKQRMKDAGFAIDGTITGPPWALFPEATALTATFINPYWAALSVPQPDRRHRAFYEQLVSALRLPTGHAQHGIRLPLRTMRTFDPLPEMIQEQARWGRLSNDPHWNEPGAAEGSPATVPFIDITDEYEQSVAQLGQPWETLATRSRPRLPARGGPQKSPDTLRMINASP